MRIRSLAASTAATFALLILLSTLGVVAPTTDAAAQTNDSVPLASWDAARHFNVSDCAIGFEHRVEIVRASNADAVLTFVPAPHTTPVLHDMEVAYTTDGGTTVRRVAHTAMSDLTGAVFRIPASHLPPDSILEYAALVDGNFGLLTDCPGGSRVLLPSRGSLATYIASGRAELEEDLASEVNTPLVAGVFASSAASLAALGMHEGPLLDSRLRHLAGDSAETVSLCNRFFAKPSPCELFPPSVEPVALELAWQVPSLQLIELYDLSAETGEAPRCSSKVVELTDSNHAYGFARSSSGRAGLSNNSTAQVRDQNGRNRVRQSIQTLQTTESNTVRTATAAVGFGGQFTHNSARSVNMEAELLWKVAGHTEYVAHDYTNNFILPSDPDRVTSEWSVRGVQDGPDQRSFWHTGVSNREEVESGILPDRVERSHDSGQRTIVFSTSVAGGDRWIWAAQLDQIVRARSGFKGVVAGHTRFNASTEYLEAPRLRLTIKDADVVFKC